MELVSPFKLLISALWLAVVDLVRSRKCCAISSTLSCVQTEEGWEVESAGGSLSILSSPFVSEK